MVSIRIILGILLIIIIIAGVLLMRETQSNLADLLPDGPEGWKISGKDRVYNRKNLYEYIDGGAELYLSYDFNKVINRIYSAPGQPDILLDLFDMGSSQDSYGVFSHGREIVEYTFGQGSQYTSGLLLFWKDRYFVSILASPETEESKEAVFTLAGQIDAAIEAEGPLPEILSLLPRESLIEASIRYFHHYIWLNSYYFVAQENILRIDEKTDAVLAKYSDQKKRHILLVVKYPGEKEAETAYENFVQIYLPELSHHPAVKIEDGTWTACRRIHNHIVVVFNADEEMKAISLMKSVENRL